MTRVIEWINTFLSDTFATSFSIPAIQWNDVAEIIIIAFFIYQFLKWTKNTRAWMLFRGIMVILIFFAIAAILQMSTILWLGKNLLNVAIIAFAVVFQPELRKALETLGRKNVFRALFSFGSGKETMRFNDKTLGDLVKASFEMGAVRTGALIVIEQEVQLAEYVRTGIPVDAVLTRQLLINIFEKNTPLHDGAVIVRGDRVVAATCYLPLTDNLELSKDLGTRHRAAVGISEVSDALTIVVSEETGKVSVTMDGVLRHDLTAAELTEVLRKIQYEGPQTGGRDRKKKENPIEGTGRLPKAEEIAREAEKAGKQTKGADK